MKVMIMAAGTGGHVFPGIAIAQELRKHDINVCWLGSVGGMEKSWVEKEQIIFNAIKIKGLRGNGFYGWLIAPVNILRAMLQARKIIKQTKPNLVLGMGGFVCGPAGLMAKLMGIKLVIHEQNAVAGLTNRLLAKIATLVISAFPQQKLTGKKVLQLGNPVRDGLEQVPTLLPKPPQQPFNILVLGGSRGALALNKIMPKVLKQLLIKKQVTLIHQTGEATLQPTIQLYKQEFADNNQQYKVMPFIDNILEAYQNADLVICRAGALTVSELMATSRPAIMIPYPFAVDDHQSANAQFLTDMGGGEVIKQTQLTVSALTAKINYWLDKDRNILASNKIRQQSTTNATSNIVKEIIKLLN